ncbi:MAG: NUDIX hydrolase [Alphaproteobacteria bacterium]
MKAEMHRVGAIPFALRGKATALLFVTSQTRGRWIFPKGLAKSGETHAQTCHREGFEEGGVSGIVLENFPFTVVVGRQTPDGIRKTPVTYYPLYVQEQSDTWPDQERRQRHWALLEDTPRVAYRDDLLALIKQFEASVPWIRAAAERETVPPQGPLPPER